MKKYSETYKLSGLNYDNHRTVTLDNDTDVPCNEFDFLESVKLSKDLKSVTLYFKENESSQNHSNDIKQLLDRITVLLISTYDISVSNLGYHLSSSQSTTQINSHTKEIHIGEKIGLRDDVFFKVSSSGDNLIKEYSKLIPPQNSNTSLESLSSVADIFKSNNITVQFLGLYDYMSKLICGTYSKPQTAVTNFFGKHKDKYPFVTFVPNSLNSQKNEDIFTNLRNTISHSQQVKSTVFAEASNNINPSFISLLLKVIIDLISGEVQP